ncbi:MAG: SPOR domain-containing protein [Novosphingobium sp.]
MNGGKDMRFGHGLSLLAAVSALALAGPVHADVKAGVDAWSAGDYATAVKEWQEPAAKGDPDAQFNLAQAYRLGRGVAQDEAKARELYAAAAKSGHIEAGDHYGLMLFQTGRREEALPYVQAAAGRGDPRAQYLLGIAYFNGDFFEQDWVRAYALMTLAHSAGLPQAVPAMAQMDEFIPLAQRQEGAGLAATLKKDAEAARASQLAAADLGGPAVAAAAPAVTPPAATPPAATSRVPRPVETMSPAPSTASEPDGVARARIAVAEAVNATGAESPATAGADYARPATEPAKPAAAPQPPVPTPTPAPAKPAPKPDVAAKEPAAPKPPIAAKPAVPSPSASPVSTAAAAKPASGPWRLQLGAFSVPGNADKMWKQVSGRPELSGKTRAVTTSGRLTLLTAGGFASQADANAACASLKRAGHSCLVTR